jgi:hypothetical protein
MSVREQSSFDEAVVDFDWLLYDAVFDSLHKGRLLAVEFSQLVYDIDEIL